MRTRDLFKMAVSGVFVHKSRSILTMLGIVIGITSVMVVISIGESAQGLVLQEIQQFGPANVFVLPGKEPKGFTEGFGTLLNDSLKQKDIEDLEKIPDVIRVVPYAFGTALVSFESESERRTIIGSSHYSQSNFNLEVASGRYFDAFDVDQKARVAVIGYDIKEDLFGQTDPVGKKLRVKNTTFQIIGVLTSKGQGSFVDYNDSIFAPYPVVQRDVLGTKHFQRVAVEVNGVENVSNVVLDIERVLRDNHNIDDPDKDDFFVQTQEEIAQSVDMITGILTVLLGCVAAISLVVGGVGIMNIMLVSVTERTREIGLRKALGATSKNILYQFLAEAIMLTGGGGIVGVALGIGLTFLSISLAQSFLSVSFPAIISIKGIALGLGVSAFIGIVFGVFPARQAAKKAPIEALRNE